MTKNLLWAALLLPGAAFGQNFIKEGVTWYTEYISSHLPTAEPIIEEVTLEATEEENCFLLYTYYDKDAEEGKKLTAYLKTDGEKVLFRSINSESDQWYTLYDFGLTPGEGCYVGLGVSNPTPIKTYVKCVAIDEGSGDDDWTLMTMEEYKDSSCSMYYGKGIWIKGLGAQRGIISNAYFEADGGGSTLLKVTDGDKVVYESSPLSVASVSEECGLSVLIEGDKLLISAEEETVAHLYSRSGMLLGTYNVGQTPLSVSLPGKGVYILESNGSARKIIL